MVFNYEAINLWPFVVYMSLKKYLVLTDRTWINSNSNSAFMVLNLHLLTDFKAHNARKKFVMP